MRTLLIIALIIFSNAASAGSVPPCAFPFFHRLLADFGNSNSDENHNAAFARQIQDLNRRMIDQNTRQGLLAAHSSFFQTITVATLNAGMLNRLVLPFQREGLASVPDYEQRRIILPHELGLFLREISPDIFFLQEIWELGDLRSIQEVAEHHDYLLVASPDRNQNPSGLVLLFKKSNFNFETREVLPIHHVTREPGERLANLNKGFQGVRITHNSGASFLATNFHFAYSSRGVGSRLRQADALGRFVEGQAEGMDFVIAAGDTNASDVLPPDTPLASGFFRDQAVVLRLHQASYHANLIDTFRVSNPDNPGYTQDPRQNVLAAVGPSTRAEPRQRLDYILFGQPTLPSRSENGFGFYVEGSQLLFTHLVGTETLPLSDHLPVLSRIRIYR